MLFEIFKFEIQYRAKRPDTYLYFIILFLYSIIAVDFLYEGNLEPLKRNAPFVIARTMGIVSALFMMITSMIMGVAVLRDFEHQMESLIFVNPIKKRDYLLGRFLGSFVVLVFIFSGLLLGMILGDFMPWHEASSTLPFQFWHYLQPFLCLVLPTLFFGGAIFFVTGALSRRLIVVYTQGFFFLMTYLLAMNLAKGSDDLFITALIEPFTFQTIRIATQFWTVIERNALMIPMEGVLLYNRLMWIAMGLIALVIGHYGFIFNVVRGKSSKNQKKATSETNTLPSQNSEHISIPSFIRRVDRFSFFKQFVHHTFYSFKSIIKEVPFWTIVLCGMGILLISSFNLGTSFGVDSYPTTYILVGELMELTVIFFLAIIVFYSGELVWKERDARISGLSDALPVSDLINLSGKFFGLILTLVALILAMIVTGVLFQAFNGYYEFELGLYFTGFFVEIFPFLFLLTFICFFFQSVINHKFLAHMVVVMFVFAATIVPQVFGWNHGLYTFGGSDLGTYSDMNGYGHLLKPYLWYKTYWVAFMVILFIIAVLFSIRGTETQLKTRWKLSMQKLTKTLVQLGASALLIFTLTGCYIFYNTNVLNSYSSQSTEEALRADYEKTLKTYEYLPQPKIVDVKLKLDLYPYERDYSVEGCFVLVNKHDFPIDEIHIQKLPNGQVEIAYLDFEGVESIANKKHERFGYTIYELAKSLRPLDSLKMSFKQTFITTGFSEGSNTNLVYNGTFFDNFHFPTLGYNEDIELKGDYDRGQNGLKPKIRRAKIDDPVAMLDGRSGGDGEEIDFEMVIGTDSSQIAVVPGYLQNEWVEGSRKYFHYKMDKPMSNFYSIVSAQYEIKRDQWMPPYDSTPVNLEIYYHKGHEYNLDRMMNGMKKSLDYFSKHFSPYQYRQMRILESPIYKNRAQSFPNTVPFSEGIGFIMDIDDEEDVDMAFYVTAHEMAHQWWGHQVNPANVQGMSMLSESLAQYSALMVLKQEYPEAKVEQLLKQQRIRYLKGRSREKVREMPIARVESGQEYIHYGKGLINLFAFQDYVSEDSVNIALKRFIEDWDSFGGRLKSETDRYPTSVDLLGYFKEVTPDSLQYIIEDLFETITLYDNKIKEASYESLTEHHYEVSLMLETTKYRVDSLGTESVININDWIEIGVYGIGESGEDELIYLKKHKITSEQTQLQIEVRQRPVSASIDPKHKLIEKNIDDNKAKCQQVELRN